VFGDFTIFPVLARFSWENTAMRETLRLLVALTLGLGLTASAWADTQVTSFDNFLLNNAYGSWGDPNVATLTSGPTSFDVESLDFGGGFKDIIPNVDATGETTIEFDVSVLSSSIGEAGFVLALGDTDFTEWNYAWYGNLIGNHVLTKDISTPSFISNAGSDGVLDLSALDYIHIQVDPGGANSYSVSFNNLALTGASAVPEPASVALMLTGVAGLFVARRRYR
jgi:PEP-CTERM motif